MRASVSAKLIFLVPVVVATWFLTSSLMAQQGKKPRPLTPKPTTSVVETAGEAAPGEQLAVEKADKTPAGLIYRTMIKETKATVNENGVTVTSSAELVDSVGNQSYLWRLRVFSDGVPEPTRDLIYDHQLFSTPRSGMMSPTFTETLPLPQGKHRLQVVLYAVPKGFDLSHLEDEAVKNQVMMAGNITEISVP